MSGNKGELSVGALRDRILVLTKHLDAATKSKANQQTKDIIRLKLCDAYCDLTTKYPNECNRERKMVVTMWQYCFYKRIGEIRVRIMKLQARNKPVEQEKLVLDKFIREGISYMQYLLKKCKNYHVLQVSLTGYLGDLHRYKEDYAGAEKLYNDVIKLDPKQGVCYNGIAVVNQENKLYLNSVYYYIRSMTVRGEKYCNGMSNLQRVLREVKRAPEPSDKSKRFVNNILRLIDTMANGDNNEPVLYYDLIGEFTTFIASRSLGELILIKINVILMFFASKNDDIFELLIVLNEKIVDNIISSVDHEKKKKNVRYLAPVVVLLDYFVENKLFDKVEKFNTFVSKVDRMLHEYSYLISSPILSKRHLKEHLNLRGCSLLNYQLEEIPYEDIERNIANDENSTRIRLSRASDFLSVIKVAQNLVSLESDILVNESAKNQVIDIEESSDMSVTNDHDSIGTGVDKPMIDVNSDGDKDDDGEESNNDDDEEDIVVFKPQVKFNSVAPALPQAAAMIGSTSFNEKPSVLPLPPPGFAPLSNFGSVPISSINPFLIFSDVQNFEPEKKVDDDKDDPMNIMGSIFGPSLNPFLEHIVLPTKTSTMAE